MVSKISLSISDQLFTAVLYDNATAHAFIQLLPITLGMLELNGNEKYADLPRILPVYALNPQTIYAGDLMLYGADTLVLFYQKLVTTYNYSKIGRIENPAGLQSLLGSGTAMIQFNVF